MELLRFEFDWVILLLLGLLDFKLFFSLHCFRFSLSCFGGLLFLIILLLIIFLIIFFIVFFGILFLGDFGFLGPFFNQVALFEGDDSVFSILNFKADCEGLLFGVLSWGFIVADMLSETVDIWLVFDQNFDWLLPLELNCLG